MVTRARPRCWTVWQLSAPRSRDLIQRCAFLPDASAPEWR